VKKYITSERPNLFEPNVYISMVVKIEGNKSREDVRKAIEYAYAANEATLSKNVLEDSGEAYYEKTEMSGCKIFFDSRDWKAIIGESERIPFSINEGELVRTYITARDHETILLIHAHHLVGDGNSILILIKDIVSSLAGEQLTFKPMILIDKTYLEKRAKLSLGVRIAVNRGNHKWEKAGRAFGWDDYYAIHKKYWESHSSHIEVETHSAKGLKRCCMGGVTLNSYLITTLLKEHPRSKVVGIPLSIRESNEAMSNQTSGIAFKYQYQCRKSFEENLSRIHKKIHKRLQNVNLKYFVLLFISQLNPTLIDSVLLQTHGCYQNLVSERMAKIMGYLGTGGRDLGVTNLMKIDIPGDYNDFKIKDILFIPPKVSYTREVVGVCTYDDGLNVCYHKILKKKR